MIELDQLSLDVEGMYLRYVCLAGKEGLDTYSIALIIPINHHVICHFIFHWTLLRSGFLFLSIPSYPANQW